jgi:site-specific DNA recombinase
VIKDRVSAGQKFQFKVNLSASEYYSDVISDNVIRAREQKIRKGEWLSKAPTGYRNIRISEKVGDIIVDTEKAPIVQEAFKLYATGAYSLDALREKINKEYGIKWIKGSLGKILSNPFYHGTMIIKGQAHPHRYATLMSKELFDDAQKIKNDFNTKPHKIMGVPKYMYRGVLRCGTWTNSWARLPTSAMNSFTKSFDHNLTILMLV